MKTEKWSLAKLGYGRNSKRRMDTTKPTVAIGLCQNLRIP